GAAALLAKTNDVPIKAVYIYEQPEWTALVVGKDSPITSPRDLNGRKVAATKGTDPYFFLLRTLNAYGLSQSDVELVDLQHDQGRRALERGQVEAWAGLDPHMAASELEAGSRLVYRNKDFNTYGFLNGREAFLTQHPDATRKVLELYERARRWTIEHPEDAARILSEESQVSMDVARRELFDRMNLRASAIPGEEHTAALKAVIPIMKAERLVKEGSDPERAVAELIEPVYARAVVGG
ncbi:MAG: aliphatic sulfonate ABC transporter substrate-binding protein, partial [Chloroflexota bacterium]|nr:aliphatic sulfonate ABC transporter substrate-binding protein [Chloroflexota bacterium]